MHAGEALAAAHAVGLRQSAKSATPTPMLHALCMEPHAEDHVQVVNSGHTLQGEWPRAGHLGGF